MPPDFMATHDESKANVSLVQFSANRLQHATKDIEVMRREHTAAKYRKLGRNLLHEQAKPCREKPIYTHVAEKAGLQDTSDSESG